MEDGEEGLFYDEIASKVTRALGLAPGEYATHPGEDPALRRRTEAALRDVVNLRVFLDLERGWRVTMPNLEQVGLIEVGYLGLDGVAARDELWRDCFPALRDAAPEVRERVCRVLLDEMRRSLAIDAECFDPDEFDRMKRRSQEALRPEWAVADGDQRDGGDRLSPVPAGRAPPGTWSSCPGGASSAATSSGPAGSPATCGRSAATTRSRSSATCCGCCPGTAPACSPRPQHPRRRGARGYRVRAAALIWRPGDGTRGGDDPLSRTFSGADGPRVNPYFVRLYRDVAQTLAGLVGPRAHRPGPPRAAPEREEEFRDGELKLLYCSPTMELGVDIAGLNAVVHAQRPAHPGELRAALRPGGPVRPARPGHHLLRHRQQPRPVLLPQLRQDGRRRRHPAAPRPAQRGPAPLPRPRDLARRGRPRAGAGDPRVHRHGRHRAGGQAAARPAPGAHRRRWRETSACRSAIDRAVTRATRRAGGADGRPARPGPPGGTPGWVEHVVRAAPATFDRAFDRWRDLFRGALVDQWEQNRRRLDYSLSQRDRDIAGRRRNEAETQLRLLRNEDSDDRNLTADFNPYRYLASEGFLPGYSFPRLPIAAYIPGRPAAARRRRLRAAGQVPGDQGVRPARADLPRGRPVRGQPRPAARRTRPARSSPTRRTAAPAAATTTRSRRATTAARCARRARRAASPGCCRCTPSSPGQRQRITSDEEERRRAGFRIVTSYRFQDHGDRPGPPRRDRQGRGRRRRSRGCPTATRPTVRRTNLGPTRRPADEADGFWLDPVTGEWLSATAGRRKRPAGRGTTTTTTARRPLRTRVIPYVQDRRNILVLQLAEPAAEAPPCR